MCVPCSVGQYRCPSNSRRLKLEQSYKFDIAGVITLHYVSKFNYLDKKRSDLGRVPNNVDTVRIKSVVSY